MLSTHPVGPAGSGPQRSSGSAPVESLPSAASAPLEPPVPLPPLGSDAGPASPHAAAHSKSPSTRDRRAPIKASIPPGGRCVSATDCVAEYASSSEHATPECDDESLAYEQCLGG